MASSGKNIVFNTRERLVSTDLQRAQVFAAADVAEAFRHMLLARLTEESAGDNAYLEATQTSPVTSLILAGLLVKPQIGGTSLLIEPGAAYVVDPTGDTANDDSPVKFVKDPGVTTPGTLTFLANAGPGVRLDVVECSLTSTTLETSSRDVFDPSSGSFVPTVLPKVKAWRMTYRIRRGTAGGGFPGTAAGWLPLMVAAVPAAATNWDGCVCWDVRPLLADRHSMVNLRRTNAQRVRSSHVTVTALEPTKIFGYSEREFGQWIAGGALPTTGLLYADVAPSGFNWDSGNGKLGHIYAAFPGGLPRWCKYKDASTGDRTPDAFRGIPVLSNSQPNRQTSGPSAALTLPAYTGITAPPDAVHLFSIPRGGATSFGEYQESDGCARAPNGTGIVTSMVPSVVGTTATADFTLKPDVIGGPTPGVAYGYYPANAKRVKGVITYSITTSGAVASTETFATTLSQRPYSWQQRGALVAGGATAFFINEPFDIILPSLYPFDIDASAGTLLRATFQAALVGTTVTVSGIQITITDWEF